MTRLLQRLAERIAASGPISVADYMAQCLFDPEDGYYTSREPFGPHGDFVTAPEISQMFGELIGVWLRLAWEAIGRPTPVTIAEIGPGRGTLMKDVARTLKKLDHGLSAGADLALIEISQRLREIQQGTLADIGKAVAWHESVATLPPGPLMIVGNEIFDAVPVRQFVRTGGTWRERAIGVDEAGALRFVAGAGSLAPDLLPHEAIEAAEGAIVEIAPARSALMATIAGLIAERGGCGLFIDYGYVVPAVGDTFQALRRHRSQDVFDDPGQADLTSHVDFAALAAVARTAGLDAHLMTQGDFLLGLGLVERAGQLGANADSRTRETISQAVERLAGPDAMGELFKVLAIVPRGTVVAPFNPAD